MSVLKGRIGMQKERDFFIHPCYNASERSKNIPIKEGALRRSDKSARRRISPGALPLYRRIKA